MRRWVQTVAAGLSLLAPRASLLAQSEPGSELKVTLLTYESGGAVWERFGHNAIRLQDQATGSQWHYDYGRFDFTEKNFFLRFAQGKMFYSMGADTVPDKYIRFYTSQGRKVWEQELDLTPAQRRELREFLEWNIRPENAGYAYDYYLDNCSTRIRDALDRVLGGVIRRYGEQSSGFTWRDETRRLNQHNAALYSGLLLTLGRPVEEEMSRWGQMFLPIRLREHLDSITVAHPDGTVRPLVKSRQVLAEGGSWPVPPRPSSWTWRYLLAGVLIGGALLWSGARSRGVFLLLGTLWALLAGIAGVVITWLALLSGHRVAHHNENLLLFNLLALALAFILPAAIRGRGRALKPARILALASVALAALALLLKALPGPDQHNLELIGLALPIHAGLWLGLRSLSRSAAPGMAAA